MAFRVYEKFLSRMAPPVYSPELSDKDLKELEETFLQLDIEEFQDGEVEADDVSPGANQQHNQPQETLKRNPVLDEALLEEQQIKDSLLKATSLQKFREDLPVSQSREEILENIRRYDVVIISGETGSGKTTQIPQFILEDMIKNCNGSIAKIIVTQPRRISAITVAQRVALERGERCSSNTEVSVGYQVRHESCLPRDHGSILFCTTGVVLQRLKNNPLLQDISHVVLDEVHERDLETDLLVTILKDLLTVRSDLKVILMSASMDSAVFQEYFPNNPVVEVKGRTFPVKEYYLEDVLSFTEFEIQGDYGSAQEYKDAYTIRYNSTLIRKLAALENNNTNLKLVSALIKKIHETQSNNSGAILVFLTGWDEQEGLYDLLTNGIYQLPDDETVIHYLHSLIDLSEQRAVFEKPEPGKRKIILSTNIAETSVTIDDVIYVVDTGKIKMSKFDAIRNITTLKPEWVSRSNAKQRAGRAGRVQAGICYHLFSLAKKDSLDQFVTPEISRSRLEGVVLQINILQLGKASEFLLKSVSPPPNQAVTAAVKLLTDINALKPAIIPGAAEELTHLGHFLSMLPISPNLGKMVILGAIFSCLDPILSIASVLSERDIFVMGQKTGRLSEIRKTFAGNTKSDHLMLAKILKQWQKAFESGLSRRFCNQNCLNEKTLEAVFKIKQQMVEILRFNKLISMKTANQNSSNDELVLAIIAASLYPNVGKVSVSRGKGNSYLVMETAVESRVYIHIRSVNARETFIPSNSPAVFYHKMTNQKNTQIHDTSLIKSLVPILLFGGRLRKLAGGNQLSVDDFSKVTVDDTRLATLILNARMTIDRYLEEKLESPWVTRWNDPTNSEVLFLNQIIKLMTND